MGFIANAANDGFYLFLHVMKEMLRKEYTSLLVKQVKKAFVLRSILIDISLQFYQWQFKKQGIFFYRDDSGQIII